MRARTVTTVGLSLAACLASFAVVRALQGTGSVGERGPGAVSRLGFHFADLGVEENETVAFERVLTVDQRPGEAARSVAMAATAQFEGEPSEAAVRALLARRRSPALLHRLRPPWREAALQAVHDYDRSLPIMAEHLLALDKLAQQRLDAQGRTVRLDPASPDFELDKDNALRLMRALRRQGGTWTTVRDSRGFVLLYPYRKEDFPELVALAHDQHAMLQAREEELHGKIRDLYEQHGMDIFNR